MSLHGSVPNKAADVQPGLLSWRKHYCKNFMDGKVKVQKRSTGTVLLYLPTGKW